MAQRILFAASEAHPLIKTGGLGDVAGSLPQALRQLNLDVRLIMPAYRDAVERVGSLKVIADDFGPFPLRGFNEPVQLLEGCCPATGVPVWFVECAALFDRPGNPYQSPEGYDWPDNARRFGLYNHVIARLARGAVGSLWRPDILHCNDWQSGLAPALLAQDAQRPGIVFTIHNLTYQGLFPAAMLEELGLPAALWTPEALEFWGQLSFMKGGLVYSDLITTVSPSYAHEIRTPEFGVGLDGLLNSRADRLRGILNGVDYSVWNPDVDLLIPQTYRAETLVAGKAANKAALQLHMGLANRPDAPLIGLVNRLVDQKGIDLVLAALPELIRLGAQIVILGAGERRYEAGLRQAMRNFPDNVAVEVGYSEPLSHLIEAGADMFLMPSRFEPCGLNQIYSLRYGTIPIVRRTGGLNDTVVDASPDHLALDTATGVVFEHSTVPALVHAVARAIELYRQPQLWRQLQRAGMRQDYSWARSAEHYRSIYTQVQRLKSPLSLL